jgi:hypothetical protein
MSCGDGLVVGTPSRPLSLVSVTENRRRCYPRPQSLATGLARIGNPGNSAPVLGRRWTAAMGQHLPLRARGLAGSERASFNEIVARYLQAVGELPDDRHGAPAIRVNGANVGGSCNEEHGVCIGHRWPPPVEDPL